MTFPPLRPTIEAIPIRHEGQPMMLVRDHEGLFDETLLLPLPMFLIFSLLDGRRDAAQVRQALASLSGGQLIQTEEISEAVRQLEGFFLLENDRTARRRREVEAAYEALPTRPAAHAGGAYPAEPRACLAMFDGLFDGLASRDGQGPHPRGLILPHIDYRVGGRCIAQGLTALAPAHPADLYVILGVAHGLARNLFTLTDKSFETPLGLAETDQAAVERLRELYGKERLAGAMAHRGEHSVEFAAIGLKYLHRDAPGFRILPLLCGSLHESLGASGPSPMNRPEVREFIDALRQLIDETPGRVNIIASVDLSHVGKKFGDAQGVNDLRADMVRDGDDRMLQRVEAFDAEGFFDHFRPDQNARNVDAVTAVYVLLQTLRSGRVERINYHQWREVETDSMVTFASLALY